MKHFRLILALALSLTLIGVYPQVARADVTLNPTDDTFVRDKAGERDTNFDGHVDQLNVTAEGFPIGAPVDIAYLRFDLSSLSGTSLTGATLRLYGQYVAPNVQIAIFSTGSDDWNGTDAGLGGETTLTFNNAPSEGSQLDSAVSSPGSAAWWEFSGPQLRTYVQNQLPDNGGDGYVTLRVKVVSTGMADIQSFEDHENGGGTGNVPELVLNGDPTAVTLSSFAATSGEGHVLVEWETASEIDNIGFNLYRSTDPDEGYLQLNETLIPSQAPGSMLGAHYAYTDSAVEAGLTYYYRLEDIDAHGVATRHGPVSATVDSPSVPTFTRSHTVYLPIVFSSP